MKDLNQGEFHKMIRAYLSKNGTAQTMGDLGHALMHVGRQVGAGEIILEFKNVGKIIVELDDSFLDDDPDDPDDQIDLASGPSSFSVKDISQKTHQSPRL